MPSQDTEETANYSGSETFTFGSVQRFLRTFAYMYGSEEDLERIAKDESLMERILDVVQGCSRIEKIPNAIPDVEVGTHADVSFLARAIRARGFEITGDAQEVLPLVPLAKERKTICLARVSLRDLGFTKGVSQFESVFHAARLHGFDLCPPEVALQLRLRYLELNGDFLWVGMEPFVFNGIPEVFVLLRDGQPELALNEEPDGSVLDQDWVFVRR